MLSFLQLIVSCNERESIEELQDVIYLGNNDLYFSKSCYSIGKIDMIDGIVITTKEQYEELADSMKKDKADSDANCDTASLIDINFNKYSLIGIETDYGACDSMNKKVLIDNTNNRIIYDIDIKKYSGSCIKILIINYNLALIPKISDNYTMDFIINEHY